MEGSELRLETHTPAGHMPVHGCRLAVCSVYVQLVIIIEVYRNQISRASATALLYKVGPANLSRTFPNRRCSEFQARVFDN